MVKIRKFSFFDLMVIMFIEVIRYMILMVIWVIRYMIIISAINSVHDFSIFRNTFWRFPQNF